MIEEREYPVVCTCGFCAPTAGQEHHTERCGAPIGRCVCTREPGHLGAHVACGGIYHPVQDVD